MTEETLEKAKDYTKRIKSLNIEIERICEMKASDFISIQIVDDELLSAFERGLDLFKKEVLVSLNQRMDKLTEEFNAL